MLSLTTKTLKIDLVFLQVDLRNPSFNLKVFFQIQKFSINKEETKNLTQSLGKIFQERTELPEPPKQSFFKGFFGGGVKQLDRDELFGAGKASSSVAQVAQGDALKGLTVGQ